MTILGSFRPGFGLGAQGVRTLTFGALLCLACDSNETQTGGTSKPDAAAPVGTADAAAPAVSLGATTGGELADGGNSLNAASESEQTLPADGGTDDPDRVRDASVWDAKAVSEDGAADPTSSNDAGPTSDAGPFDAAPIPSCDECLGLNCVSERKACAAEEHTELMTCYEETACAQSGASVECFCGSMDPIDCFSAGDEAEGACATEARAAMGTDDPSSGDVLLRWTNSDYAGGRVNLLYACEHTACATACGG